MNSSYEQPLPAELLVHDRAATDSPSSGARPA
jgi:hypothetical protein